MGIARPDARSRITAAPARYGTLPIAFDEAVVEAGGSGLSIGIAPANARRPVWTYWVPLLCLLSPERLQAVPVAVAGASARPFVYPVELRWEVVEWCARNGERESLVVLPPEVGRAARAGRAIVLVSMMHESRVLFAPAVGAFTLFDALARIADEYDLAPGQLWFVHGDDRAAVDLAAWLKARGREAAPFTARECEPFSAFVGASARECLERGRVPDARTVFERRDAATIGWRRTRLGWRPRDRLVDPPPGPGAARYACLNRAFRPHRWAVLRRLFREGLLEHGLVSFPRPTDHELAKVEPEGVNGEVQALLDLLPLRIDRAFQRDEQRYFDENADAVGLLPPAAAGSAVQLVNETFHAGESRFLSEKSFKGLLGRGPMVLVGNRAALARLSELGVETWADLVDERYDEVPDPAERLDAAMTAFAELVSDASRLEAAVTAAAGRRRLNVRWLLEARKPWDTLLDDLQEAVA
jgi:hypothetical protein